MTRAYQQPHHDGSERYVANPDPAESETVPVFVRVPDGYPLRGLRVRVLEDGEPFFTAATVDRTEPGATWWRADVTVGNPTVGYRFLLEHPGGGYSWLTGAGVVDRDVTDVHDFRLSTLPGPPKWARDSVIYQVFPDRFASSGAPRELPSWAVASDWYADPVAPREPLAPIQVYGGDLPGIQARLDHLESLGVNVLYLTPFFTANSNHRYDARTFNEVDPLLGGSEALAALSTEVHRRGMRLIGDLTTNHTGNHHEWFRAAQADPDSAEAGFYYWTDHPTGYAAWLGFPSLPKLNHRSTELRARLIDGPNSVVAQWMRPPYGLDGWRIDVANMTGRYRGDDLALEVARLVRATMAETNPDTLLIAEHTHDYTRDLPGDGWHGVMNQAGFTRPIWRWLTDPNGSLPNFLGVPGSVPRQDGVPVVATIRDFMAAVPWRTVAATVNMLGSHDTPRIRTVTGDPRLVEVGAGLLFTFPGVPMVFAGDEIGLTGTNGEHSRTPFPWQRPETWETSTLDAYRRLIRLRRDSSALRYGGLRWLHIGPDSLVYLRETNTETMLVAANRTTVPDLTLPASAVNLHNDATLRYGDTNLTRHSGHLTLPGAGPAIRIWQID